MKLSIIIPLYNQQDLITKCLDSIPKRADIEIIVINDCSTDNSLEVVQKYKNEHSNDNIILLNNEVNKGVGYSRNRGYEIAQGEYIGHIDSDDYLITDEYLKVLEELDGTDIIYMDLITKTGEIFRLHENSVSLFCGSPCKIIKKELIGDARYPEIDTGEDWFFNEELQIKEHTRKFTHRVAYFYNFPREGSLSYILHERGGIQNGNILP